jgi:hypothetical protein
MKLVDNIIVLEEGKVVNTTTPVDLLRDDNSYSRVFGRSVSESSENESLKEDGMGTSVHTRHGQMIDLETLVQDTADLDDTDHPETNTSSTDIRRKNSDLSVYKYYVASSGYTSVTLYMLFVSLWVFFTEFSSKFDNTSSPFLTLTTSRSQTRANYH